MDYVTKDSGKRTTFESGMVRDTADDKANFFLLLVRGMPYEEQFLTRLAALMTRGARKYSARGFEKANSQEELDRFKESALRHLVQYVSGDTSEDHAAAVAYNLIGATMVEWKLRAAEELEKLGGTMTDPHATIERLIEKVRGEDWASNVARRGVLTGLRMSLAALAEDEPAADPLDVGTFVRDDQGRTGQVVRLWDGGKLVDVDMGPYWGSCVNVLAERLERI
jgi:hypothetical protein